MDYKRINLLRGSSSCLTTLDRRIINWIVEFLRIYPKKRRRLTEIYRYVIQARRDFEGKSVQEIHIKYCLLILHIKNKISISNRKENKRKLTRWETKIRLLEKK